MSGKRFWTFLNYCYFFSSRQILRADTKGINFLPSIIFQKILNSHYDTDEDGEPRKIKLLTPFHSKMNISCVFFLHWWKMKVNIQYFINVVMMHHKYMAFQKFQNSFKHFECVADRWSYSWIFFCLCILSKVDDRLRILDFRFEFAQVEEENFSKICDFLSVHEWDGAHFEDFYIILSTAINGKHKTTNKLWYNET